MCKWVKETKKNTCEFVCQHWLATSLTLFTLITAGLVYYQSIQNNYTTNIDESLNGHINVNQQPSNLTNAALTGDYLSGFAGALAFIWLLSGFHLQRKELTLQREELQEQKKALKLQAEEMKKTSECLALEHVLKMITQAEEYLKHNYNITPRDLCDEYNSDIIKSKLASIYESTELGTVRQALISWNKTHTRCTIYVTSIYNASKFYLKTVENRNINYNIEPWLFLRDHQKTIKTIPYIENNSEFAVLLSTYIIGQEISIKRARLAELFIDKLDNLSTGKNHSTFQEERIQDLIEYHKSNNIPLPAIETECEEILKKRQANKHKNY